MEEVFLPQRRKKWKDSTDTTTTERIRTHLLPAFGKYELADLTRDRLQQFLDGKARSGMSKSVVSHLRWDLNAIFKMAGEDVLVKGNPAGSLVTPRGAVVHVRRRMTKGEVQLALSVLDLRERIVFSPGGARRHAARRDPGSALGKDERRDDRSRRACLSRAPG